MGRATSLRLAAAGAAVAVADVNGEAAEETVRLLTEAGGQGSAHQVDVSDLSALEGLFDAIAERYERVDVLHNHAGIPNPHGIREISADDWTRAVDMNLKSAFFATKLALPLIPGGEAGGSIIFTSSAAGLVASRTTPLYSMTKSGMLGLMRALAAHLAEENIRVNAVCPGPVETPMLPGFMAKGGESATDVADHYSQFVPMQRVAQPEEVAEAVLFLASDSASYITGVALPVDGGYVAV
jgi:NAD(P)-dependent dehydrogenase (short-subunit alcohol dehydrogenase family)